MKRQPTFWRTCSTPRYYCQVMAFISELHVDFHDLLGQGCFFFGGVGGGGGAMKRQPAFWCTCSRSRYYCQVLAFISELDIHELLGQGFLLFVAGYETTASLLSYLTYLLALHPDIQKKLVDEIDKHIQDTSVCPINTILNQGCHGQGKNSGKWNFFQVWEKLWNFIFSQGN